MSNFVSLKAVKDNLGICDDSDDVRLWAILDWVLDDITQKIWDIKKWTKTETIPKDMRMLRSNILPFMIWPVTKITKIDATDFSAKVAWTDYLILENWTAEVTDLTSFIETEFDSFKIEYEAWYDAAPKDFVSIISTLVGLEFAKDLWKDITEESTWPRTVKWADPTRWTGWPDAVRKTAMKRLQKYIPLHLRIY